jgi:hypothetical protein
MPQCFSQRIRRLSAVISAGFLLLAAVSPLLARPSAMKLFPEETLLLVRTPNAGELFDRLRDTATGRMVRDPQVAPLVERLYGSAGDLYTQKVAEWLGVSWEELQDLPRAEVAFAIVARRDHLPAFVLLVDQGETPGVAKRMLDAALTRIQEDGGEMTKETIAGQEITVVREGDNQDHTVGIFEREQTIVAATDPGLIREILQHWNSDDGGAPVVSEESTPEAETATADSEPPTDAAEEDASASEPRQYSGQTLARNNKFVTILRHCRRTHDPPPNLMFYVDPIGLVRQFNRDNAGMAIAMATFPALGVDGLAGIGSTMAFSAGRYDSLAHLHVLLDNPRSGVMQVIALEASDGAPPAWMFADLESYFSWRWNLRTSFEVIRSLVDRFQYEGRTDKFIAESINEAQGIDFEKEIIDNAEGRFDWAIGFETPPRFRGQQSTLGVKVIDEEQAKKTLAKFVAKYPERLEERKFGDITYYPFVIEWPEELQEDPPSTPFVAVMDGYFFIGGSCQLFERAIGARDGTVDRLADAPEFVQLAAEVQQEAPGVTPALWFYSRYEESLRQWYGLLTNEKTKAYLEEHAEGNPFFAALADALAADELPPFEAVAQYAMPSVGVIYDTDTGFHGIMFSVAKDPQPTAE